MKELMSALGSLALLVLVVFVAPLIGTAVGCFVGWVVGGVWPNTFNAWLAQFGLSEFQPWQVGAMLGFVGAFFRPSVAAKPA